MENSKSTLNVRQLPLAALLTALVVILQIVANNIQPFPGVSITLVLVPVVLGAALLGPYIGLWLGFVFGVVVLVTGGANMFLSLNVPATIAICIVKGALAGLGAALVYKALEHFNEYLAIVLAAVVCPTLNTGIFLIGSRLFFWDWVVETAKSANASSAIVFMFVGLAGVNFLIELAINVVLSPVILRLVKIGRSKRIR